MMEGLWKAEWENEETGKRTKVYFVLVKTPRGTYCKYVQIKIQKKIINTFQGSDLTH